jgi:hypothetical protein
VTIGKKLDDFYRRLGNRGLLLAIFTASLILQVVLSLRMNLPGTSDEFSTAAWSAYFSGFAETVPESSSPWLAGFLYTPLYYLFENPVIRYRSMLIMNSLFAALIPLLTYKITASLGLEKAWQRTMCSVITGIGTAVSVHTKFIGTATLSVFLPFLLFYLFTRTVNTKNRAARFFLSMFAAIILAFAPAVHFRLWTLVAVFILLVFYTRFILRVKSVSLVGFFAAFAVFTALQLYISRLLTGGLFVRGAGDAVPYIEQLYHLAVSTWGIGVLGIVLCAAQFWRQEKNAMTAFAFFALVYNAFLISVDSASPLLVLFAFCYIFNHGLDFKKTVFTAITLGIIFVLYYNSASVREVSSVFCVIALLFVLVSCADRYRRHIITFCLSLCLLYSGFHTALIFLPAEAARAKRGTAAAHAVSEFIYNAPDAPPTYIISSTDDENLAPLLRFLNRNTTINTVSDFSELPEDCFVITRGADEDFIFIAHGERTQAYVLSQEE